MSQKSVIVLSIQAEQSRLFIHNAVFGNTSKLSEYLKTQKNFTDSQIQDLLNFKCLTHFVCFYTITETSVQE